MVSAPTARGECAASHRAPSSATPGTPDCAPTKAAPLPHRLPQPRTDQDDLAGSGHGALPLHGRAPGPQR